MATAGLDLVLIHCYFCHGSLGVTFKPLREDLIQGTGKHTLQGEFRNGPYTLIYDSTEERKIGAE
jgi:hypothetical protein